MQIGPVCTGLALVIVAAACISAQEIRVDTPAHATLDMSPFRRVLVAGFVSGGDADVDANVETVRLLRSQLRSKTSLTVIDANVDVLEQFARSESRDGAFGVTTHGSPRTGCSMALKREKDLNACEHLFADVASWRRLGQEYQDAMIVTGTLFFTAYPRGGSLIGTFLFIDGRTGTVMHSESVREKVSSDSRRAALSWYFLLMDRVIPVFLRVVSDQPRLGTRTLLR